MSDIRKERAAKGLCPTCGEMAAPYYLCDRCHQLGQVSKLLRSMAKADVVKRTINPKDRRQALWSAGPRINSVDARTPYGGLNLGERGKPRLRGVPVDIIETVVQILREVGRPMTEQEIAVAWVKLRPRPGKTDVAREMVKIIEAGDRRTAKLARRAAAARKAGLLPAHV